MKVAVAILSDPLSGGEDALGRLFNGLAAAHEFKQHGDDVRVIFQGAGTRWLDVVTKEDHPVHELFQLVADKVAGASCGCADAFGARESLEGSGFPLLQGNDVPGTSGLPSLRDLLSQGYSVLNF